MSIKVRFFASLRERLGSDGQLIDVSDVSTVADVWQKSTDQIMPSNTLMAVNMEYVSADYVVKDGDEIAFFPPVTGG